MDQYKVALSSDEMFHVLDTLEIRLKFMNDTPKKVIVRKLWEKLTDIYEERDADEPVRSTIVGSRS